MYQTDPSGNYGGWKATAIGANSTAAQSILKSDYKEGLNLKEALNLVIKVLSKTMDSTTLLPEKLELSTLSMTETGKIGYHQLRTDELETLLKESGLLAPPKPSS